MKLYFASGNAHKVAELQKLADESEASRGLGWEIVSAREIGGMPPVVEDAGTFIGNARKKAAALKAKLPTDAWVLADDSGLCVDALNGGPGVESAYFAGAAGDSEANLRKLQEVMRGVPPERRGAHFVCVLVLLNSLENELVAEGWCEGRLLNEPRRGAGFGYDPLFVPLGYSESFSELGDGLKSTLSHRALAWDQLAKMWRTKLAAGAP